MLRILKHPVFARLFAAQVVALLGTGLLTVALALLAYDLAGARAGTVLGTALTLKMVAYVVLSPVLAAALAHLPRKAVLVGADLIRAGVALALPFIDGVWQIYGLIFVLQAASASFTPAFQATIPDVLTDEADYTNALSLSRLAYDLENIVSPMLAGILLVLVSFDTLFLGTVFGFLASAILVVSVSLPSPSPSAPRGAFDRTTRGVRLYLAPPRLRGLWGLRLPAASGGAMVLINSVVLVRGSLGLNDSALGWTMAAYGAGSILATLPLPRLLDRFGDRPVMLCGAGTMIGTLVLLAGVVSIGALTWPALLAHWLLLGMGYSAVLTPAGRLLRRSATPEDRPALFAAQFALSHACWLVTYPLSGWLMTWGGTVVALMGLAALGLAGFVAALLLWPAQKGMRPGETRA